MNFGDLPVVSVGDLVAVAQPFRRNMPGKRLGQFRSSGSTEILDCFCPRFDASPANDAMRLGT